MSDFRIRFDHISKSYGALRVVDDLNLQIRRGEFVSLLGPSGSGKTTLLMMLAGFEAPSGGNIYLDDELINDVPTHRRNMGVVFQNYALFPHMTVADNVAFPLQMRGVGRAAIEQKVTRILDMVQLETMRDRRPSQLSGGQQQRVALARALVFEPHVVLMDEPLGALDKQLREQMQLDIRELHKRLELTIVFVTHDQSEALTMSDRIAIFNKGKIEQIGPPRDVYDRPATRFVAEFIGETNLMEGIVEDLSASEASIRLSSGRDILTASIAGMNRGDTVLLSIRPERIHLSETGDQPNSLAVRVADSVYQGDHLRIQLDADGYDFVARLDRKSNEWAPGSQAVATFSPSDCWVITR